MSTKPWAAPGSARRGRRVFHRSDDPSSRMNLTAPERSINARAPTAFAFRALGADAETVVTIRGGALIGESMKCVER